MKYNGRILGVLGGMGPMATAYFLQVLAEKTPVTVDQEHPRLFLYSNPATPDRTKFILGKGESPMPFLVEGIEKLKLWGANILAIPCNTSHFLIDQMGQSLPLPIVHIIDETIKKAKIISQTGAWLLSTEGTRRTRLYDSHAAKLDFLFEYPTDEIQNEVNYLIDQVKAGKIEEAAHIMELVSNTLWQIKNLPVIAACTEIPVAYSLARLPQNMIISSIEALAEGCIRELYKPLQ